MGFEDHLMKANRTIDGPEICRIVEEANSVGIGCLPNYLTTDCLEAMRRFVVEIVSANAGEYLSLAGPALSDTLFGALGRSDGFVRLMRRVYEEGFGGPLPQQSFYQVLRCVKGRTGLKHSYIFHYDSYCLTALVPVIIPLEGQTGNLIMLKKRRPVRASYVRNLADKILLDNKVTQTWLRHRVNGQQGAFRQIRLIPGNVYFFWGYRTVHANAPCDPENIRATALVHYGDPHVGSRLRRFTGRAKLRASTLSPFSYDAAPGGSRR